MQGVVKTYDDATGIGLIVCDDRTTEVLLKPGSLDGSLFRMLRQGQRAVDAQLMDVVLQVLDVVNDMFDSIRMNSHGECPV